MLFMWAHLKIWLDYQWKDISLKRNKLTSDKGFRSVVLGKTFKAPEQWIFHDEYLFLETPGLRDIGTMYINIHCSMNNNMHIQACPRKKLNGQKLKVKLKHFSEMQSKLCLVWKINWKLVTFLKTLLYKKVFVSSNNLKKARLLYFLQKGP